ncbi:hypothetical protein E3G45_005016 [Mycobacteroides abscessus]|uniref:hypothetical protein n=1 Tax=Mycobacteroides abscessus TaxID=36809 RepID=UPI0018783899|nr:hypothetical protein [Mycobacteroides abscessus]
MQKRFADLEPGDVVTHYVLPGGRLMKVQGGPFEVSAVRLTGDEWEGAPQVEISCVNRNRAHRYSNGSTFAIVQ